jgi:TPR repeat protein
MSFRISAQEYYNAAMYSMNVEKSTDWINIYHNFKSAANGGHVDAIYQLGLCYTSGNMPEGSPKEAFECYLKAAEKGHVKALYALSECYVKGSGCEKNHMMGQSFCKKAADIGNVIAQYRLLLLYNIDTYAPKSRDDAIEWYRHALTMDGWISNMASAWYYKHFDKVKKAAIVDNTSSHEYYQKRQLKRERQLEV